MTDEEQIIELLKEILKELRQANYHLSAIESYTGTIT